MSSDDADWSVPIVHGLNDGETVQWSENAGISIMLLMRSSCAPLLILIVAVAALSTLAEPNPTARLIVVAFVNPIAGAVALLFLLYGVYLLIQVWRTTYCITSERLLEVRGGSIKKEIPRTDLKGLKPKDYMRSVWAQKGGGRETYNIYVTDSVTGVVIRMTSLDNAVEDRIERWVRKGKD